MRYLISGYYGDGNLGDEAILAGILQEVRRRDRGAEFTVMSFSPQDTERRHDVAALPTSLRDPGRLLSRMGCSDLLISGGGSFLHEADFGLYGRSFWWREGKLRPVPYFLSVMLLARSCGLPVFWYAQGLGPLHTRQARRLVPWVASESAALTWRDRESAALAATLGAPGPLGAVVPDPAYALEPVPDEQAAALLAARGLDSDYLAVAPRPWLGRRGWVRNLAAALARVVRELGLSLLFLPLHGRADSALCRELAGDGRLRAKSAVMEGVEDPRLMASLLGRARLCITMRLHAGILAAAGGAPAAIIDYDPKVRAFARQTGQERWSVPVDELETAAGEQRLVAAALDTARDARRRRASLATRVARLRKEAGNTAQLAVQVASGELRL